jgi:epoxyqueuosine reductase
VKLLLHTCCGPCSIFPVRALRAEGVEPTGFFYPHNIHPYTECLRRRETLAGYAETIDLPLLYADGYDLEGFVRRSAFHETERCLICYRERLGATAALARAQGFAAFSSTLLYSRYQNHRALREIGEAAGSTAGVAFHYRDFRTGWQEGVDESRRLGMYRQKYCGCIYSEKERFFKADS